MDQAKEGEGISGRGSGELEGNSKRRGREKTKRDKTRREHRQGRERLEEER